jgi:hypothetical protein
VRGPGVPVDELGVAALESDGCPALLEVEVFGWIMLGEGAALAFLAEIQPKTLPERRTMRAPSVA